MQALRNLFTRTRASSFLIDPARAALTESTKEIQVSLEKKAVISPNVNIFRFKLPKENQLLGTKAGQAISLSTLDKRISRCYMPISNIWDEGFVDVLVRIYRKAEHAKNTSGQQIRAPNQPHDEGNFSELLEKMPENEKFILGGPFGKLYYEGGGNFFARNDHRKGEYLHKKTRYIGIIAHDLGVTAFFQILEAVAADRNEDLCISLLYYAEKIQDVLLLEEFISFHDAQRLVMNVMLREAPETWPGLKGNLNTEILSDFMPPSQLDPLIMVCGPKGFRNEATGLLQTMKYKDDMVVML